MANLKYDYENAKNHLFSLFLSLKEEVANESDEKVKGQKKLALDELVDCINKLFPVHINKKDNYKVQHYNNMSTLLQSACK